MYFDRPEEQATVSIINAFSGTATLVVMNEGTPRTFKCSWREDRPRIDEGDVVKIKPITSTWARVVEVISRRLPEPTTTEETVTDAKG